MKKIMKVSKILLLIATVFSYIASPIAVLADEIIGMKLNMQFEAIYDENGYVDSYNLTYKSENVEEYENDKTYNIELVSTFDYLNENAEDVTIINNVNITGAELNDENGNVYVFNDPISKYYDGTYNLDVTVYDGENEIYADSYQYNYSALKGLIGKINEVSATNETIGITTVGNYNDVIEGNYVQNLTVLTGELSPSGEYRIAYSDGTFSEIMSADVLRSTVIYGTSTDLIGKLAGVYSYTDTVIIQEVKQDETLEYNVLKTYTYNYDAIINYGTDNDDMLTTLYGITFEDGYVIVDAKREDTDSIITINELVNAMAETGIEIEILDEEGNVIDLDSDEVLASEVKNNYVVRFTNGASASYNVVVKGDITSDNIFDSSDLKGVMEGYIDEENMPSMDMITLEEEEFGFITFEDVIITNELLKDESNVDKEVEDNKNLTLMLGDTTEEVFVGDIIEVQVLLNSEIVSDDNSDTATGESVTLDNTDSTDSDDSVSNDDTVLDDTVTEEEVIEYIDGIDAIISTTNFTLTDVKVNEMLTSIYKNDRVVAVGGELDSNAIVMTLILEATTEGSGKIEISGETAKYLNTTEFSLTKNVKVNRVISNNNNLSSLSSSNGTFDVEFDKNTTVYTLMVSYDTESVILSGNLEDSYATVEGLVEYKLTEDKTTAIINVTAEDGSVKTYTVYIVKESAPVVETITYYYSSNNYLKLLEVNGYEIEFNKYTNEYNITVKNDITSLDIKALAEDYRSRVEITGNESFSEGKNTVVITVTAENGTVREYKLIVDKEDKKPVVTDIEDSSNTAEKVVIVILIILVVLGLLYLIFKKDDGEENENKASSNNDKIKNSSDNNIKSDRKDVSDNNKNNIKKKKK